GEDQDEKPGDAKGDADVEMGDDKRRSAGEGYDNHDGGGDDLSRDRGLADDDSADDADGLADGPRQPDPRLPQRFKGDLHEEDFGKGRKGNGFPGRGDADEHGGWEHLRMNGRSGDVDRGNQERQRDQRIAQ